VSVVDMLFPKRSHDIFGSMRFAWGRWTGNHATLFGHQNVRVRIPGTRREVSPHVGPLLEQVAAAYPRLKQELLAELYDEFDDVRYELGNDVPEAIRSTTDCTALWPHVTLARVWVDAHNVRADVELAYRLAWDVEHTRGITVRAGKLHDYCFSVAGW
jgi:hypothetical protein